MGQLGGCLGKRVEAGIDLTLTEANGHNGTVERHVDLVDGGELCLKKERARWVRLHT